MTYLIRRLLRGLLTLSLVATTSSLPAAQAAPVLQVVAAADLASCIDALNAAFANRWAGSTSGQYRLFRQFLCADQQWRAV